jgi:hypothetical protein
VATDAKRWKTSSKQANQDTHCVCSTCFFQHS